MYCSLALLFMNNPAEFYFILQLDRSRRRWRWLATLFFIVLVVWGFSAAAPSFEQAEHTGAGPSIARVDVIGFIDENLHHQQVLQNIADDESTKALMVYLDSSGGTLTGGLSLFHALRAVAAKKPVVVYMGTTAASAAYMAAIGADYIVANEATLTGSVGVFLPMVDASDLAAKVGIKADDVASGSFKNVPSPLVPRTASQTEYLHHLVKGMETVFAKYVQERRQLPPETMQLLADGRAVIGTEAVGLKLVDATGTFTTAREWLASNHNLPLTIPTHAVDLDEKGDWFEEFIEHNALTPLKNMAAQFAPHGFWSTLRL